MKLLPVGNGLHACVDDDIFEAVGGFEWTLTNGKPYLREMQPTWEGSRSLHRNVMGIQDPGRWVIFRDGHFLNCQRDNLFAGTSSQCNAFWRLNPLPEPEVKTSHYTGVVWHPKVRAWTLDYEGWPISNANFRWFADEQDAARHFDTCIEMQLAWERERLASARLTLEAKSQDLDLRAANLVAQLNFGGLENRAA